MTEKNTILELKYHILYPHILSLNLKVNERDQNKYHVSLSDRWMNTSENQNFADFFDVFFSGNRKLRGLPNTPIFMQKIFFGIDLLKCKLNYDCFDVHSGLAAGEV